MSSSRRQKSGEENSNWWWCLVLKVVVVPTRHKIHKNVYHESASFFFSRLSLEVNFHVIFV